MYAMETDFRAGMLTAMWSKGYLNEMMLHTAQNKNVAYIYYTTPQGEIICHSFPSGVSSNMKEIPIPEDLKETGNRMVKLLDGETVLEIRKSFSSHPLPNAVHHRMMIMKNGHTMARNFDTVIGLYMREYENARKADLQHAVVMMAILASLGAGGIFFLFVIKKHLSDLEHIKRLEDKVRKSEKHAEIGKLAAAVAHEIRNPLSSIKGFAQFLGHLLRDDPENCEYADIMVKELDRINRVITNLLTFARPLAPQKKPIHPMELIEHTVLLAEGDVRHRNVAIETEIQREMKPLNVDGHQMTQVLLNLFLNSLRELQAGEKLVIGAANDLNRGDTLIWIEDEGPGIPQEYQDKIFDPFFTRHEKGTGLGLSITKKIIENHGGEISVKSPLPGSSRGCRFTITIPLENHLEVLQEK